MWVQVWKKARVFGMSPVVFGQDPQVPVGEAGDIWCIVLERLSWRVTCPNYASFSLLTVARRRFGGPTRKLILLRTHLSIVMKYGPTSVA